MMNKNAERVQNSARPEDLFGVLTGTPTEQLEQGKKLYRELAQATHPDQNPGLGDGLFQKLSTFWEQSERRIQAGTYGQALFSLKTKATTYEVQRLIAAGDCSDLYQASSDGKNYLVKLGRDPRDNDLLANEVRVLKQLRAAPGEDQLKLLFPNLVESFQAKGRAVTVFAEHPWKLTPMSQVLAAYPNGIDPRDMVWMWKRCLLAVGYAHSLGVVHGAVTPDHLLLDLENHGAQLAGWTAACLLDTDERVSVVSPAWEALYPPEILKKAAPTPATDLYLLAGCICRILGGTDTPPASTPKLLARLLRACLNPEPRHRLDDAAWLHREIDALLNPLFGPRTFRVFALPEGCK